MRKLILKMSMSLDALVGSPDGRLEWLFKDTDEESTAWTLESVWDCSLHVMGSHSFQDMSAHWPTSTAVFAPPMNQIPKAVFSRRGNDVLKGRDTTAALESAARAAAKSGEPGPLQEGAESWTQPYVASGDLVEEIAHLKSKPGKPMIAYGGASFARSLVAHGVVDEYHLLVHPVVLGKGLPLFTDLDEPRRLKLVSAKAFPAGSIAQIYRPR